MEPSSSLFLVFSLLCLFLRALSYSTCLSIFIATIDPAGLDDNLENDQEESHSIQDEIKESEISELEDHNEDKINEIKGNSEVDEKS